MSRLNPTVPGIIPKCQTLATLLNWTFIRALPDGRTGFELTLEVTELTGFCPRMPSIAYMWGGGSCAGAIAGLTPRAGTASESVSSHDGETASLRTAHRVERRAASANA
jgi:hypothetical protein